MRMILWEVKYLVFYNDISVTLIAFHFQNIYEGGWSNFGEINENRMSQSFK